METFDIIGFPINLGCDKDGNELTPDLLRKCGCYTSEHHRVEDLGDIPSTLRSEIIDQKYASHPRIKFLDPILKASRLLAEKVWLSLREGHIPVAIGGDHVMAFGSIAGVGLAKGKENYAVVYIDAHGDFNTEVTSTSGNMHGMHLSFLMGLGDQSVASYWGHQPLLDPKNIYFLGSRAFDPGEKEMAKEVGMYVRTTEDLNRSVPIQLVSEILSDIKGKGIEHIHLSFDVDAIDPKYAPGTGVPERDGITPAMGYELITLFIQSGLVSSVDIVELNIKLDKAKQTEEIIKQVLRIVLQ